LRVEEVKILTLDFYQAMLNFKPLGGEQVPFFCIVYCSICEKNISEWCFVSITKEEIFFSIHTGHRSKETPQRVPLSLYLHNFYTRKKRAKKPHLPAGFSPVLGFLGHILCLFIDGVCVFIYVLYFFHLNSFICFF
jgi:hypothetical protein